MAQLSSEYVIQNHGPFPQRLWASDCLIGVWKEGRWRRPACCLWTFLLVTGCHCPLCIHSPDSAHVGAVFKIRLEKKERNRGREEGERRQESQRSPLDRMD